MTITRLPFTLTDWTRLIWMSEKARSVWAQRINNINEAWSRMERWAVVDGARQSALTFFEPHYLPEASMWAASHGLVLLPMAQVGVSDQYSATPKAVDAVGGRWQYRAVLTHERHLKTWMEAWRDTGEAGKYKGTNNRALGELLGYPPCCIDFFEREWVGQASVDTTWAMGLGTHDRIEDGEHTLRVVGPPETNILLRWLGVRLVPHLPCSFTCEHTIALARSFAQVGRDRHFTEWVDYIYEMLEWPVEWSALHGVAEIRTPVLTISTRTNATAERLTVQRVGSRYPVEGVRGLRFPFQVEQGRVTGKPAFHRAFLPVLESPPEVSVPSESAPDLGQICDVPTGLQATAEPLGVSTDRGTATEGGKPPFPASDLAVSGGRPTASPPALRAGGSGSTGLIPLGDEADWRLNGFGSAAAMREAHDVLLSILPTPKHYALSTLLDLGCGNGRLLARAFDEKGWRVEGVEIDPDRVAGAVPGVRIKCAPLQEISAWTRHGTAWPRYGVVALMPGRLIELGPNSPEAVAVRNALREQAGLLLLYGYGDWLTRYAPARSPELGLRGLLEAAGFPEDLWWHHRTKAASRPGSAAVLLPVLQGREGPPAP